MHSVNTWAGSRTSVKLTGPYSAPFIAVGYRGRKLLTIHPQTENGTGYGLTVVSPKGKVLLVVDMTEPPKPGQTVLEVAKRARYRFSVKQPPKAKPQKAKPVL
jgi:hypothetical protein